MYDIWLIMHSFQIRQIVKGSFFSARIVTRVQGIIMVPFNFVQSFYSYTILRSDVSSRSFSQTLILEGKARLYVSSALLYSLGQPCVLRLYITLLKSSSIPAGSVLPTVLEFDNTGKWRFTNEVGKHQSTCTCLFGVTTWNWIYGPLGSNHVFQICNAIHNEVRPVSFVQSIMSISNDIMNFYSETITTMK